MNGGLKKAVKFFQRPEIYGAIIAAIFGGTVFLIFFNEIFWPQNLSWVLADGGDSFNHQVGWEFFRNSPWSWPPGIIKNLNYPLGISVVYTDSLPLLAIFFKLWHAWLPVNFQYTGLWLFFCFILQGVYGFLLTRLIKKDVLLNILGSLFFILSPIVFQRVAGHAALVGHFVILGALYIYLSQKAKIQSGHWFFLLVFAFFTSPYMFFMVAPFWLIDELRLFRQTPKKKWWRDNLLIIALMFLLSYLIGLWQGGESGAAGWGDFSMNLNSLFNPMGWSKIMPEWPIEFLQYEGFNYLGLGILLLVIFSVVLFVSKHRPLIIYYFKKFWPIVLISFGLTILALTNKIYFNKHLVLSYPLPHFVETILSTVRSSGRLFWPVYYLIFLFALFPIRFLKRSLAITIIIVALILQIADLSKGLINQHLVYTNNIWQYESKTSFWNSYGYWNYLLNGYEHVVYLPYFAHYDMPVALLVARSSKTLTAGEFTRKQIGTDEYIAEQIKKVCAGNFSPSTIYIFYNDLYKCLPPPEISPQKYLLKEVFNFHVLLPK